MGSETELLLNFLVTSQRSICFKFNLQMLDIRDHNERSSTGYDVYGDQNLNNLSFDENFGSSDSGDEEEHDNHNPLLLAVIPSTEIATADTTTNHGFMHQLTLVKDMFL